LIVMLNVLVVAADELSVTLTLKLNLPGPVGVPAITPLVEIVRPAGGDPDQLYGGVPPAAAKVCE
jgi:hypothetical protein